MDQTHLRLMNKNITGINENQQFGILTELEHRVGNRFQKRGSKQTIYRYTENQWWQIREYWKLQSCFDCQKKKRRQISGYVV